MTIKIVQEEQKWIRRIREETRETKKDTVKGEQKNKKKEFPSECAILLVDDESDITLTLKRELEDIGFATVDTFNDPQLALSSYKPDFYDFVLLDVKMPKMNGFELYREIEKREHNRKTLKTCFITAHEIYYESLKKEYPTLNVGCFVTKPIEIEDLVRRLKELE